MNVFLYFILLPFSFTLSSDFKNYQYLKKVDCSQFYNEIKYSDLKFEGKLKSKSKENGFYILEVIEIDQTVITLKLFKNNLTDEIFTRASVNDLFIKNKGEETLRVGYFVAQDLNVKLYDGLCE